MLVLGFYTWLRLNATLFFLVKVSRFVVFKLTLDLVSSCNRSFKWCFYLGFAFAIN